MSLQGKRSKELFEQASKVMPHGVNSNFRYWGVENTLSVQRGEGAYIWDVDGKRYIDYRLGFGPIILGHGYPAVVERVQEAIKDGTVFAMTTPLEVKVAERLCRMCHLDKVRLTNTGTEATMHALRIARAHTNREKYIKFEGQYHGMADYFMFSTASSHKSSLGSRLSPTPSPTTSGIPRVLHDLVIVLPYNDIEMLEKTVEAKWWDIAAIFVEPIMGNSAGILPKPGFLEKMRELCDKYSIGLVMDEVKTGFRVANGGAQEYFGIQADIVTYAKAMANGYPIAAIGGKEAWMMTIQPGSVAHGGTYSGNFVGTAAADVVLDLLETKPILKEVFKNGQKLMDGISDILTEASIPHKVTGVPSMFSFILGTDEVPHDFRAYCDGDDDLYERLAYALVRRGVMPDPDGREPWFMSYSHGNQVIDETLSIFKEAVWEVKH
jgi:glutamate-1-semialdehyde 2,1-aminomutase